MGFRIAGFDCDCLLILSDGVWDGRMVVPAEWIKRCMTPVVPINEIGDYGYQWYIGRRQPFWAAVGNGGQRLFASPKLDLVAYPYLPKVTVATTQAKSYMALLGRAAA